MAFLLGSFTNGLFSGARSIEDIISTAQDMRAKHDADKMLKQATDDTQAAMSQSGVADATAAPAPPQTTPPKAAIDVGSTGDGGNVATPGSVASVVPTTTPETLPQASIFKPPPTTPPPFGGGGSSGVNRGTAGTGIRQPQALTYLPTAAGSGSPSSTLPPGVTGAVAPIAPIPPIRPIQPIAAIPSIPPMVPIQPIDGGE